VPAIAVALLLRTFVIQPFVVPNNSMSPELTAGSRILVWKLTSTYAPGDIVAYWHEDKVWVARVTQVGPTTLTLQKNKLPSTEVQREAVVGKVISVFWRPTPGAVPAQTSAPIEKAAGWNRTSPAFPYTISGRTTGGTPLEVGGFADVIVSIHGADPSNTEMLPIVRGVKVTKITDNDSSISNYRLVDLELELTRDEVDLIKQHEHRHSFSFAPVDVPPNAIKLVRIEERGKTRDGRDFVMVFEELQRDEKTSTVTIKAVNGGSVGSAMFDVRGNYEIAKARGAACFINLKAWEGKDGARMYLTGFAPNKDVDPTTYFDLKEPLPAAKRHLFLSVKDYEPLFNPLAESERRVVQQQYEKTLSDLFEAQRERTLAATESEGNSEQRETRARTLHVKVELLERRSTELRTRLEAMLKLNAPSTGATDQP
jgi:hypothetical protein